MGADMVQAIKDAMQRPVSRSVASGTTMGIGLAVGVLLGWALEACGAEVTIERGQALVALSAWLFQRFVSRNFGKAKD